MTAAQKVIKCLAVAFAVFLIVTIFTTAISVLFSLGAFVYYNNEKGDTTSICENIRNIKDLDIDTKYTALQIKISDDNTFKAESNNKYMKCKVNGGSVKIEEKRYGIFSSGRNRELIIYIPANKNINEVDINTGAGKVDIEKLKANKLKLDLGAGSTNIKYIETNNADIETGAGKFTIEDGILNDLDFDIGAGEANVNARLLGDSKIEVGVGNLNLNLLGSKKLYKLKLEKGIGEVRVDGSLIENDSTVGNGNNYIRIEGGIGSIKVNYER